MMSPAAARAQWVRLLCGDGEHPGAPEAPGAAARARWQAEWLAHADRTARSLDPRPGCVLWPDLPDDGASAPLTTAATRVRLLAVAAVVAPTDPFGAHAAEAVTPAVTALLPHLARRPFDNWWDHEIGIPLHLADAAVLGTGRPDLTAELVHALSQKTAHRSPGTDSGANLLWHTRVDVVLGLARGETSVLVDAAEAIARVFAVVDEGDGIHSDGSFVQHARVAYTGGYGVSLLATLSPLVRLLDAAEHPLLPATWDALLRWIEVGMRPYMFDGRMSDAVRGREVSRRTTTGLDAGVVTTAALLQIADARRRADAGQAHRLDAVAKGWMLRSGSRGLLHHAPHRGLDPAMVQLAAGVLDDDRIAPAPEAPGSFVHPAMARAVHRGADFAMALTATTRSIDSSEHINDEHRTGWFAGYGTRYLETRGDPAAFDGFWPFADPHALPGLIADVSAPLNAPVRGRARAVRALARSDALVFGWNLGRDGSAESGRISWLCHAGSAVWVASALQATGGDMPSVTIEDRRVAADTVLCIDSTAIGISRARCGTLAHDARTVVIPGVVRVVSLTAVGMEVTLQTRNGAWAAVDGRSRRTAPLPPRRFLRLAPADRTARSFAYLVRPGAGADEQPPTTSVIVSTHAHTALIDGVRLCDSFHGPARIA
jgi:hyaluronate lyase